jgi:hypothetical protein
MPSAHCDVSFHAEVIAWSAQSRASLPGEANLSTRCLPGPVGPLCSNAEARPESLRKAPGSVFGEDLDVASIARAAADTDARPADHEVGVHRAYVDPVG